MDFGVRFLPDIVSLKDRLAFQEQDEPWPGGHSHHTPVCGGGGGIEGGAHLPGPA